jgi:hypothetical protein
MHDHGAGSAGMVLVRSATKKSLLAYSMCCACFNASIKALSCCQAADNWTGRSWAEHSGCCCVVAVTVLIVALTVAVT